MVNFLAGIVGDDQHTAAEDPYSRAMKTRKWLLLAATLVLIDRHDFFSPAKFPVFVGALDVPGWAWSQSITVGAGYLLAIYSLLLIQLAQRYLDLLRTRIIDRHEEAVALIEDAAVNEGRALLGAEKGVSLLRGDEPRAKDREYAVTVSERKIERLQRKLERLRHLDPAQSRYYVGAEAAIDFIRLAPPLALASFALLIAK
jgi:hypothetical protein